MRLGLAVLLIAAALAGCLGAPDSVPETAPEPGSRASGSASRASTYYLEPGRRLSPETPTGPPTRVEATPWINGFANEDLPPWVGPAPRQPLLVQGNATLTLYYTVDRPVTPVIPNAEGQAFHFVPWFGSRTTYGGSGGAYGPPVLLPGEVYNATIEIPMPSAGFRLTPDAPVQVLIATLMNTQDATPVEFLVGSPETPSRVTFDARPVAPVDAGASAEATVNGTVAANGGLFLPAPERSGVTHARHELDVAPGTRRVDLGLTHDEPPAAKFDIDMTVLGPDGEQVAAGSTPYQSETAVLWPETLAAHGPGTYTVRVDVYSGALVRYEVEAAARGGDVAWAS